MMREPNDREILAFLVNRFVGHTPGPETAPYSVGCSFESMAAGRRQLVTYALRRYGNQPVTDDLIDEALAQVNAAVSLPPR